MIPHSRPALGPAEQAAVARVVASGQVARGAEVEQLETEFGRYHGLPRGAATSSGTAALHLALRALGVGPGDEVIIPAYACKAVYYAVQHCAAQPVVVDVEPTWGNLDLSLAKQRLTKRTRAIVAVHTFGFPCTDIAELLKLGVPVIEDCATSLGAEIGGRKTGTAGTASVFSLYATKMICAGEGGMVLSRDAALLDKIRDLNDYDNRRTDTIVRYNYKMTDLAAALGRAQLSRLDEFIGARRELAQLYSRQLANCNCRLPVESPQTRSAFYRYIVQVDRPLETLYEKARAAGVATTHPVGGSLGRMAGQAPCPVADSLVARNLSIPLYPGLARDERQTVIDTFTRMLAGAGYV